MGSPRLRRYLMRGPGLLRVSSLLSVAFVVGGASAYLQHPLQSPYPQADGWFGWSVSGAGDVNNDGYDDLVVGARNEDGGAFQSGTAHVFDGHSGGILGTLNSPNPQNYGLFGVSVSGAGDVNNDGHDDLVVGALSEDGGASFSGRAYVFSGNGGTPLYTLESPNPEYTGGFGLVSGAGDVNNDGHDDIIVGAYHENGGATNAGRAYVFSGNGAGLLYTLQSPNPGYDGWFGCSVSGAGDLNNDGYADVIVGAEREDGGASQAGRAYVFSGNGGGLLHTMLSPSPQDPGFFGASVSAGGDIDGDSYPDVVVGANYEEGGATYAGRSYVMSGSSGTPLLTLQSPWPEFNGRFGTSVSGAGDVNGDGCNDIIVGTREYGAANLAGRAYVFSGSDGGLLHALESPYPESRSGFGSSVSGAGDVNNDGRYDVVVGAHNEDGGAEDAGRAYAFTFPGGIVLSIHVDALYGVFLQWTPLNGAAQYWLYHACNDAHFDPAFASHAAYPPQVTTWSSPFHWGDPANNWTYLVLAVDASDQVIGMSNRVGEFDFDFATPP
jgi:hypothetical protein